MPGLLGHRWGRVLVLGMLYLVQGLPFGFQVSALPIFLFDHGVDIQTIGFSTALALPWALKWAEMICAVSPVGCPSNFGQSTFVDTRIFWARCPLLIVRMTLDPVPWMFSFTGSLVQVSAGRSSSSCTS